MSDIGKKCFIRNHVNIDPDENVPKRVRGTIIDENENSYYVRVWYGYEMVSKNKVEMCE